MLRKVYTTRMVGSIKQCKLHTLWTLVEKLLQSKLNGKHALTEKIRLHQS